MPLSVPAINRFLLETKKETVDFKRPGLQAAFLWRQKKEAVDLQAPRPAGRFSLGTKKEAVDSKLPELQEGFLLETQKAPKPAGIFPQQHTLGRPGRHAHHLQLSPVNFPYK